MIPKGNLDLNTGVEDPRNSNHAGRYKKEKTRGDESIWVIIHL